VLRAVRLLVPSKADEKRQQLCAVECELASNFDPTPIGP
jgi:hypothetical protein